MSWMRWRLAVDLLLEMGRISRGNMGRDEALKRIADLVLAQMDFQAVAILLIEESARSAYVAASSASCGLNVIVPEDMLLRLTPDCLIQRVIEKPSAILETARGCEDPVLGEIRFDRLLAVPMASGEGASGVILAAIEGKRRIDGEILTAVAAQVDMIASKAHLIESLSEAEERYRALMENASDLVFVLDDGGRFLYVNGRAMDLLGYEPSEMIGRYFGEFVTPDSWASTVSSVKNAARNKERFVNYRWLVEGKAGQVLTLDVRATLLYQGYRVSRHQGIARAPSSEDLLREELSKRDEELSKSRVREERMRDYLALANAIQEEERSRIARDLHDGPVQMLVALRRRLDLLRLGLPQVCKDSRDLLAETDELLDRATRDIRDFCRSLRPPVLDDFGLISACEWLADQADREGVRVTLSVSGKVERFGRDVETGIFRIAQEALSNAMKHSGASEIEMRLDYLENSVRLQVKDNGKGFELPQSPGVLVRAGQMGLVGMYERAEILNAEIMLDSKPGQGTILTVIVPTSTKPQK